MNEKVGNGDHKTDLGKENYNGQKRYICTECGKSFTRKSSLIVHQRVHTGEKLFMCTQCGKRFGLKSSMVRHLRIHKAGNFICPDCGKCFPRYSSLFQHQKVQKGDGHYRNCKYGTSCVQTSELVVHQKIHGRKGHLEQSSNAVDHIPTPYRAEEDNACKEGFRKSNSLIRHQGRHNANPLLPAVGVSGLTNGSSICHKSDSDTSSWLVRTNGCDQLEDEYNHTEGTVNSIERRVVCAECGKSFTRKSSLIVHQRVHTGEKRFVCVQCGKRFGLKSSMVRHLRTHSPKMLNICPDCGKCFNRYSSLFQHQKVHRRQKSFQFKKSLCGASHQRKRTALTTFLEPDSDDRDQSTNNEGTAEEPHMDPSCGESFLEQMFQEHQGKYFIGTVRDTRTCSSVFEIGAGGEESSNAHHKDTCNTSQLHLVEKHSMYIGNKAQKMVRSAKEHFLCAECGKSFTRKSSLIVHQRVHTGEKLFMCTQCGKRFGLKSSMVRHLRIHKAGNFICPDCGKCFPRYSSLFQHQKVHRRVKPYKCCQCDKSFRHTSQLVVHLKTHKAQTLNLKAEDKRNNNCINGGAGESHVCWQCGQQFWQQDLLLRHEMVHTASDTSSNNLMNAENIDFQGCDTKDDFKTFSEERNGTHLSSCKARDNGSRKALQGLVFRGVESAKCTKAAKSDPDGRSNSGEKPYHCIECGKYFTRKSSLIVHQRVHTGEKLYVCTECRRRFAFKSSLVRHMRTHTGQPPNICSQCGICLNHYQDLSVHMEIHNGQLPLNPDDDVLKMEPDEQQWLEDIQGSSDADNSVVPLLNELESALLDRAQMSHDNPCLLPGAPVMNCVASSCTNVKEITQEDSPNIKEEDLENPCTAGENLEKYTNGEMTACPYSAGWGLDFEVSKALNKCTDMMENIASPLAKTTLKHVAISSSGVSTWAHGSDEDSRAQSGGKRFLCAECGKSFTRKSSLIVHQRVHTGEKSFMCTKCGKMFGLKSSMVRHMRTHS